MNPQNFRDSIISPTLKQLGLHSQASENLLFGTAAQESKFNYIKQISGPALGFYQCEPNTYHDIWRHYLNRKNVLAAKINQFASYRYLGRVIPVSEVIGNIFYATAICRVHYYRQPAVLPDADDIDGLAAYWKLYYNSVKGRGTVEEFIESYHWAMDKSKEV